MLYSLAEEAGEVRERENDPLETLSVLEENGVLVV